MEQFELMGIGSINLTRNEVQCNFTLSYSQFFRKFQYLLGNLPNSLLSELKYAIKHPSKPHHYKSIFHPTLKKLFVDIQGECTKIENSIHSDTVIEPRSLIHRKNPSFQRNFRHFSQTRYESFLKSQSRPILHKSAQKESVVHSNQEISNLLNPIIRCLDSGEILKAKQMLLTLLQSNHSLIGPESHRRLEICDAYIHNYLLFQKAESNFASGKIKHALLELKTINNNVAEIEPQSDLIHHLKDRTLSLFKKVEAKFQVLVQEIEGLYEKFVFHRSQFDPPKIIDLLHSIEVKAKKLDLIALEEFAAQQLIFYQNVICVKQQLLHFENQNLSRIHIGEILQHIQISPEEAILIIKLLIAKNHIRAIFDEKNQGIQFTYMQDQIDFLLAEFKDWESQTTDKENLHKLVEI